MVKDAEAAEHGFVSGPDAGSGWDHFGGECGDAVLVCRDVQGLNGAVGRRAWL